MYKELLIKFAPLKSDEWNDMMEKVKKWCGEINTKLKKSKQIDNNIINNEWHNANDLPEEDKWIIVKDIDGREYNQHQWNGSSYYDYVINDYDCIGMRSRVNIVAWRYDYECDFE